VPGYTVISDGLSPGRSVAQPFRIAKQASSNSLATGVFFTGTSALYKSFLTSFSARICDSFIPVWSTPLWKSIFGQL